MNRHYNGQTRKDDKTNNDLQNTRKLKINTKVMNVRCNTNLHPCIFIKCSYISGLPAVITMASYFPDVTVNDIPFPQALRQLEEAGAAVVGLNCSRGPKSMLPLLREIRKVCKVVIRCLEHRANNLDVFSVYAVRKTMT